jgi:catechol 2,3-dioxygenase-like lactoylglutathione lyase family enzyme
MPDSLGRAIATGALVALVSLRAATSAADHPGPCKTAAPTTGNVHLFVSDIEHAARWYRENTGLIEVARWVDRIFGGATLVSIQRDAVGLTLVSSPREQTARFRDPQMVCFVLDGPPAPTTGAGPLFLVDPDGTSVELVRASAHPGTASERESRSD